MLTKLGNKVPVPDKPDIATLETFPNPGVSRVHFTTAEFTSLCPVTGQPDFATVEVIYTPQQLCLESKSLKLYLQSFRQEKAFMESLSARITSDLFQVLNPKWVEIVITSVPRGGISLRANTFRSHTGGDPCTSSLLGDLKV